MRSAQIALPDKLIPVFQGEADVRGAHGGRGSGKTRSFAKMVAVKGYQYGNQGISGQLLCARQFMNSLDDSSLEECKRAIEEEPFLRDYYEVGDKFIRSRDGRIWFSFAGLDRNIGSIKSKGRILVCWVDEAEAVSEAAWIVLIPTLREEGEGWNAELWVTWNPARKGSPTDKRFRSAPDARYRIVEINWRDNPMFPDVLERQRQRDFEERPDDYDHIWEGAYGSTKGSILGRWMGEAERQGRINDDVEYDPEGAPLELSSDIGFHDTAVFWHWQRKVGGFSLFDYDEGNGLDADDWIDILEPKLAGKRLGIIWLPHDARAKTFQSKHSTVERFVKKFGVDKVGIVPQAKTHDRISAARFIVPKCEFHKTRCERGLDGLRAWEYKYLEEAQAFSREPIHNFASHPSDGYSYGCQIMQGLTVDPSIQEPPRPQGFSGMTMNEFIASAPVSKSSVRV